MCVCMCVCVCAGGVALVNYFSRCVRVRGCGCEHCLTCECVGVCVCAGGVALVNPFLRCVNVCLGVGVSVLCTYGVIQKWHRE